MSQSRGKAFLNTFSIYAIGTIGAKLIAFALMPLYTFFLAKDEMGYFDLSITLIMLLVPFVTFDLRDGAFRYLIDKECPFKPQDTISFIVRTLIRNSVVIAILSVIGYFYLSHLDYYPILVATLIAYACYEVIIQVVRGMGHTKFFVGIGIINTILILLLSVIFLVVFKWGVLAIFLANLISRIISLIIIESRLHIVKLCYIHRKEYKHEVGRDLLKYTLPLLPNVLAWWAIESSSKIFIEQYLGLEYNGIFAIAIKFSNILQIAASIFYQAWQETAIKEMNAKDHNRFFSHIFNNYFLLLSATVVLATMGLRLIYPYIVAEAYQESFVYIYPLFIAVLFHAIGSFLDLAYQCSRKTYRGLPSIISTAILAMTLYYITVTRWGLMGVSLSLVISYAYLMIYRLFDTRFCFHIVPNRLFFLSLIILIIGGLTTYLPIPSFIIIIILIIGILSLAVYAKRFLQSKKG
ncbi:MAG: lipopolysaccharide biosynthesis protein [Bacteroidaceae bacterium]|nr:lipopolysaccharide biosynthesis protein [Bacteroidaceae bacterium]